MICPNCGHEWTMKKSIYMTTPYAQRGINQLFVCAKCGEIPKEFKQNTNYKYIFGEEEIKQTSNLIQ